MQDKSKTPASEAPDSVEAIAKQFEAGIRKLVKESGGPMALYAQLGGAEKVSEMIIKPFYEALLQAEMDDHLGYDKHDRQVDTENKRNGTGKKKIRGDFGEVHITTPRDRDGSFDPKIIEKRKSDVGDFTEKIISLYSRGMTTREIEEHLGEMYGIEVSAQFISRATARVEEQVIEWQNRPLEKLYPVVYVDGLRVSVRAEDNRGAIQSKCVYIVLGVDASGRQDVLGLWIEETEGAKFWLKVFTDLKARGVQDILILCGDGLKGLPDAVHSVFPLTDVQLCVVHQIRNCTKFVSYKDRKKFCADMKPIYNAPTVEAAELALKSFDETWGAKYPMSIASWQRHWELLTTFMKYPLELRKVIYTTNTIESLNAQLRKNTSNRKVFPNDAAAIRLLYLNIRNFSKKWTKRQNWDTVMNQLSIIYSERINLHLGGIAM